MAKHKEKQGNTINTLKPKLYLLDKVLHGVVGRFGQVQKKWSELSSDELAEIFLTSAKVSNDRHFTGTLHNYISPFDKPFPTIEENDTEA